MEQIKKRCVSKIGNGHRQDCVRDEATRGCHVRRVRLEAVESWKDRVGRTYKSHVRVQNLPALKKKSATRSDFAFSMCL